MNYQVYRTHLSGYWNQQALELEAESLQGISEVQYCGLQANPQDWHSPAILLSNTNFNPDQIDSNHWKKIALVLHANSGYDNLLSSKFLSAYAGPIFYAPSLRAQAVAEYVLQSWLKGLGAIPWSKTWDQKRLFPRRLAQSEKVLLIGQGHVGKILSKFIQALGAELTIFDPYVSATNVLKQKDKIAWQDFSTIIFACSLTTSSVELLRGDVWKKLRSDVIVINAARGKLLDLSEVISFAQTHSQAQFYLDVFPQEPWDAKLHFPSNIFCSSHIAGVHDQLLMETLRWQRDILKDYLQLPLADFLKAREHENLRTRI